MDAFDDLWVWDDREVADALGWYRAVAANRMPAKYRIAATVPAGLDPGVADEPALWADLERLTPVFLERRRRIREAGEALGPAADGSNLLHVCQALVRRMLAHCNFCRWDCGVDRAEGAKPGACKLGAQARVSTYFHHPGEELVYRGRHGSGTIFFTSCNMRCAFCQNGDISTDKDNGEPTGARTLATMAWLLRMEGCHNINWVGGDPTIHLHRVVEAIALLGEPDFEPDRDDLRRAAVTKADRFASYGPAPERARFAGGLNAPMLWNSNFYMSAEAMKILRLLIDVWLPDFKFGPGRCAVTLARTPRYWETITGNLALIRSWGEDQTIRHLVMPNHVACCTVPVLDWIAEHLPGVPVNVMDQFHPDNFCEPGSPKYDPRYAEIARRPTRRELDEALAHARQRGIAFETLTYERRRTGVWI